MNRVTEIILKLPRNLQEEIIDALVSGMFYEHEELEKAKKRIKELESKDFPVVLNESI